MNKIKPLTQFSWEAKRLAVFNCFNENTGGPARREVELIHSIIRLDSDSQMYSFLDSMVREMIKKKSDVSKNSSCKVYIFDDSREGSKKDHEMFQAMLSCDDQSEFNQNSEILARRYIAGSRSSEGMLFFLNFTLLDENSIEIPFFGIFKCNYESVDQFDGEEKKLNTIDDVMSRKIMKSMVYPYFDGFERYSDRVKIFQRSTSHYFDRLISVISPRDYETVYSDAIEKCLNEDYQERFCNYFEITPSGKRELFHDRSLISNEDCLTMDQVERLSVFSREEILKKVDKPQLVSLVINKEMKFRAPADQFNRNFWLANGNTGKFLIVRAEMVENLGAINPVDFLEQVDLDAVISQVMSSEN